MAMNWRTGGPTSARWSATATLAITKPGAGGEIQLTDAIEALMQEQAVYGYEFEGTRYDCGTTMGWLKASVELALERPDLAPEFRRYLHELDL